MANFVLIYSGGGGMAMSQDERQKIMAEWGAWYEKIRQGIVDGGNPFSASKSLTENGDINDGPVGTPATGYTVIAADSLDDAVAKCKDHPHLNHGGQVSVYEAIKM